MDFEHIGPAPHEDKIALVKDLATFNDCNTLIETGTAMGDMVLSCVDIFELIYTIEMDPEYFKVAQERLSRFGHANVVLGNSAEMLAEVIDSIDGEYKPLFYLDAHYSGPNTARWEESDTPVLAEMDAILSTGFREMVIVIDDARLFGGMPYHTEEFSDYPHVERMQKIALDNGMSFDLTTDSMVMVR